MSTVNGKTARGTVEQLTVGRYLAIPTGMSTYRRVSGALIAFATLLFILCGGICLMGGRLNFGIGVGKAQTVNLTTCVMPLLIAGVVMLVAAPAVLAISRLTGTPNHDMRASVKKAALSVMLKCPRMGISENTLMADVKLKCEYVPGTGHCAIQCYCINNPFIPQDFSKSRAADFAALDCIVAEGRLFIFFDNSAKKKWIETRNRKRGRYGNR